MNYFRGFKTLGKIAGLRSLCAYLLRATKKAIYLDQGRQGLDRNQIKAARVLFNDIADKYVDADPSTEPINKTIYMLWWDGFDNAPEIVKVCLDSVKLHFPDFKLVLVDKTNIKEFIPNDDIVLKSFEKKHLTIQNFSDYLRFYLLSTRGGYWVDATMLFTDDFNLEALLDDGRDFSSIGFSTLSRCFYCDGMPTRWADFFFCARKGSPICKAFVECFQLYYSKYTYQFDYFMMDCILYFFMEKNVEKGIIDRIPTFSGSCIFTFPSYGINGKATERALIEARMVPQKLNRKINVSKLKKDGLLSTLIKSIREKQAAVISKPELQ